jgi:MraZ protein
MSILPSPAARTPKSQARQPSILLFQGILPHENFHELFIDACGEKWEKVVRYGSPWKINPVFPTLMNATQPAEAIYSGSFERTLDNKNRITIPASWVSQGVSEFQVVPNHKPDEPFLIVLPPAEFARMEAKIEALDQPASIKRKAIRSFYSAARAVSADKQGRILLPDDYCRLAGLAGEVMLLGGKSRFEIWSSDRWRAACNDDLPVFQTIADQIGL